MPLEARITPIWKRQKLFMALFLIAFGLYFFWDGFYGYPFKNVRYGEWKRFRDAGQTSEWQEFAKQKGWKADEWTRFAQEHGWREPYPELAMSQGKIREQFFFGALVTTIGLVVLGYWFSQKGRILRADDEAVTTPAGTRVPFSAITGIGLKKWESKGIARVRYELEGRKGEFVVDDYKFDTAPSREVLEKIKRGLEGRSAEGAA